MLRNSRTIRVAIGTRLSSSGMRVVMKEKTMHQSFGMARCSMMKASEGENHSETRIVLLEGENIMTSKHKLCDRLKKVGYTVHLMSPHNNSLFANELLHNPVDASTLFSTSLIHHFLIHYYGELNKLLDSPEKYYSNVTGGNKFKNNVVVCDASPLYPLIYDPIIEKEVSSTNNKIGSLFNNILQVMKERNVIVMQCKADRYESAYRLGNHKHFYTEDWSDEKRQQIEFDPSTLHLHKKIAEPLSRSQYESKFQYFNGQYFPDEFTIVDYTYEKFAQLGKSIYEPRGIDFRHLDTTDTQQACCILLEKELGITFKLPFIPGANKNQ